MKRNASQHFAVAFALILLSAVRLFAFTSTQKESIGAGAFVGGAILIPGGGLKIHHEPLPAGSPVTKQFIIVGEAGDETPVVPPAFNQRLKQGTLLGPIENRTIRIRLIYRFVTQEQFQGLEDGPDGVELPFIEGTDPTSFAFEIPESSFTAAAPILQYRIVAQRLSYSGGVQSVIATVSLPPISSQNANPWVTVNAQANAANTFDAQGGRLSLPDGNPVDGESSIDIPAGILSAPTVITLDEIPVGSPLLPAVYNGAVRYYQATADRPVGGIAQVSLLYPDFQYPLGADGIVDGTNIPVQSLGVFGWDGFAWVRLGGTVDTRTGTIRSKISSFGFYAIAAAGAFTAEDRRPLRKIITPNGDGTNDTADFGANVGEVYKIEIFDVNGHRVKTIQTGATLSWDGRNDSGEVVESGVYIYQYEVEGKRISGFIAVAK